MLEKEYRELVWDKEAKRARAERQARGEPEPERVYQMPPPCGLTSRQKLDHANANFAHRSDWNEPALSDDERGMSKAAFEALSAQRRLEVINRAMFARRATGKS